MKRLRPGDRGYYDSWWARWDCFFFPVLLALLFPALGVLTIIFIAVMEAYL